MLLKGLQVQKDVIHVEILKNESSDYLQLTNLINSKAHKTVDFPTVRVLLADSIKFVDCFELRKKIILYYVEHNFTKWLSSLLKNLFIWLITVDFIHKLSNCFLFHRSCRRIVYVIQHLFLSIMENPRFFAPFFGVEV